VGQSVFLVTCGTPLLFQSHRCSWILCAGYLHGRGLSSDNRMGCSSMGSARSSNSHCWCAIRFSGGSILVVLALGALGRVSYAGFWRKADFMFSIFDNYDRVFDVVCFALFLGLFGWLGWTRRLAVIPRLGWAVCTVFISYVLMPDQIYGGSNVDHRLPTAWFVLLIASSAPRFPTRGFATAIGFVAGSILVIRLAVIEHFWHQADEVYAADLIGIDALPRGVKLAVAIPPGAIQLISAPEVHLPALAISRREAFVPTLFAYPGQQPVAMRTVYAALAAAASPQLVWAGVTGGNTAELTNLLPVLQQYDYVVLTGGGPVSVPSTGCLAEFYLQPTFQIFTRSQLHQHRRLNASGSMLVIRQLKTDSGRYCASDQGDSVEKSDFEHSFGLGVPAREIWPRQGPHSIASPRSQRRRARAGGIMRTADRTVVRRSPIATTGGFPGLSSRRPGSADQDDGGF